MSTLALIGSGDAGGTVARVAVAARRDVVLDNSLGELGAALQIQTE